MFPGMFLSGTSGYENSYSLLFDQVDEEVDFSNDSATDFERTDSFSLSMMLKKTSDAYGGYIFSRRDQTLKRGWIVLVNASNEIEFYLQNSNSNMLRVYTTTKLVAADGWKRLTITYAGTSAPTGVKFYFDSSLDTTLTATNSLSATTLNSASCKLSLSTSAYGGYIDEVSMWDKVLSGSEVTELYNSGTPGDLNDHSAFANLIMWQRCGEGGTYSTNWTLPDEIDSNLDGTSLNMEVGDRTTDTA